MPAPAQVGVRVVRVRRKQAELSKNARLRKRLQKLRESSRKLLGIHKVAPEPTFDDKLDAFFARYDADHSGLIDADELVKLLEHFIPPHVRRGKRPGWPSLADAHFILGEVDIDGDEQTISRDELRAAVNLWRRLIAETTPSQSDQLKMHGRMGFCCEVMWIRLVCVSSSGVTAGGCSISGSVPTTSSGLLAARAGCLGSGPPITSWAGGRGAGAPRVGRAAHRAARPRCRIAAASGAQLRRPRALGPPAASAATRRRRGRRWRRRAARVAESVLAGATPCPNIPPRFDQPPTGSAPGTAPTTTSRPSRLIRPSPEGRPSAAERGATPRSPKMSMCDPESRLPHRRSKHVAATAGAGAAAPPPAASTPPAERTPEPLRDAGPLRRRAMARGCSPGAAS